ncbi:hypothetical protein NDU88_001644 [Pleurodeles waltl]|uniref:Uncharacterized protein n=1 Tax=Pleurodeles waltl TaxID=8319 RepID=A0AAV7UB04_PLEWA|nr:hypothetical protein NDU88_001644 [Pleurodeles waltl]
MCRDKEVLLRAPAPAVAPLALPGGDTRPPWPVGINGAQPTRLSQPPWCSRHKARAILHVGHTAICHPGQDLRRHRWCAPLALVPAHRVSLCSSELRLLLLYGHISCCCGSLLSTVGVGHANPSGSPSSSSVQRKARSINFLNAYLSGVTSRPCRSTPCS